MTDKKKGTPPPATPSAKELPEGTPVGTKDSTKKK